MTPHLKLQHGQAQLWEADCLAWLNNAPERSIHAVVTDPPYGLQEYSDTHQAKLRAGNGGNWRIPPSLGGSRRSPVPRFSELTRRDLESIRDFFKSWAEALRPALLPGANVIVASMPLVSPYVSEGLALAGLERRGEVIRLVMTLRGGDRPKNAHEEFPDVSAMPRSQWEPWILFREPIEAKLTVAENLRKYKTGGLRRISADKPFGDVIESHPTRAAEKKLANHPSLKPQSFMRQIVRAALPLGEGVVLDPFAGSGSTLAAAEANGYDSIGVERDPEYVKLAIQAIPLLAAYMPGKA